MRFCAIFASMRVKPLHILVFSFAVCLAGSLAAVTAAEESYASAKLCTAVLGFGMGTVFATGLAWLEQV